MKIAAAALSTALALSFLGATAHAQQPSASANAPSVTSPLDGACDSYQSHKNAWKTDLAHVIWKGLQETYQGVSLIPTGLEDAGLRFPVGKPYQFPLSTNAIRGSRLDHQAQYDALAKAGVKTLIDLTSEHAYNADMALKAGMQYVDIPVQDNTTPSLEQVRDFLATADPRATMADGSANRVRFGCEQGVGRTGVFSAAYRMAFQGYGVEQAIAEAKQFGMSSPSQEMFLRKLACAMATPGSIFQQAGYPIANPIPVAADAQRTAPVGSN